MAIAIQKAMNLGKDSTATEEKKDLKIGATSGPYADMVNKAIKPLLEKKGYTVEVVEFSDYVQPNIALGNGSIDANLFQHKIYMETFAKENNLELSDLIKHSNSTYGHLLKKISIFRRY